MKANYRVNKDVIGKNKMVLTEEQIQEILNEEWEKKVDKVYEDVKNDVSNQVMSVFFTAMHKDFGFGKKRLLRLKTSVESWFSIMQTGVFGKPFTPVDCLNYLKDEFGIDLDKEDLMK